jgi:glutamate dehydrogenase/leucine dehydrogenase
MMEIRQAQREGPGGYAIPYAAAGVMVGVEVNMYVYINNTKPKEMWSQQRVEDNLQEHFSNSCKTIEDHKTQNPFPSYKTTTNILCIKRIWTSS